MMAARLQNNFKAFRLKRGTTVHRGKERDREGSVSAAEIALGCFRILPTAHLYNMPLTLYTSFVLHSTSFFTWAQFIRYSHTKEVVNSLNLAAILWCHSSLIIENSISLPENKCQNSAKEQSFKKKKSIFIFSSIESSCF